jgi:hypothetical protein
MWNWLNCYLSGRHDYGVACSSGSMYLRCNHCGKRSEGWAVHVQQPHEGMGTASARDANKQPATVNAGRALPFTPREVVQHQRSA